VTLHLKQFWPNLADVPLVASPFCFGLLGFLIRQRQWLLYHATKSSGGIYEMSGYFFLYFRAKALNR
jgi:hypothetical protein